VRAGEPDAAEIFHWGQAQSRRVSFESTATPDQELPRALRAPTAAERSTRQPERVLPAPCLANQGSQRLSLAWRSAGVCRSTWGRSPRESQRESAKEHPGSHHAMALRPICPARSLDAMKIADVSDRVRQAVLGTAGEGMWNAGAFYAELDPFALALALETGATLRNPHANPVAAVVIAPHGPLAPFPAGSPACTNAWIPSLAMPATHGARASRQRCGRCRGICSCPRRTPRTPIAPTPPWSPNAPAPPSTRRPHRRSWRSCRTCDTRSHVLSELTDGDQLTS
jgi:hypothetical protein